MTTKNIFVIPVKAGIQLLCGSLLCSFMLTACSSSNQAPPNLNMVISVSSDGNYAIATNTNKQAVLWNLQEHSYKIVFKDANIYSAYFIKNTNDFMYQNDKTNEVVVKSVDGQIIKTFNPGFPTYGEVMTSNLQDYYGVDFNDQVFKIDVNNGSKAQYLWHYCDQNDPPIPQGVPYTCGSFLGDGKLFNLNLSPNEHYLVTSGNQEFYIWDTEKNKMLAHIQKNGAQTVAAISPDGNYVVTGDANLMGYYYNLNNQNGYNFFITAPVLPEVNAYFYSYLTDENGKQVQEDTGNEIYNLLSLKFIDQNHVVTIFNGSPGQFYFSGLYDIDRMTINPAYWTKKIQVPVKYLPLLPANTKTQPASSSFPLAGDAYSRDQAIDTSPSAHILVMSMAEKNGIIVYKYDLTTQTLKREWAGEVKSSWWSLWQ